MNKRKKKHAEVVFPGTTLVYHLSGIEIISKFNSFASYSHQCIGDSVVIVIKRLPDSDILKYESHE